MRTAAQSIETSHTAAGTAGGSWAALVAWLEREGQLVLVLTVFMAVVLARLDHVLFSDSWLALVSGREIAQHGLPGRDSLTVWTAGRPWVDQQWLAQLALYDIVRVGGIGLALLVHGALVIGAFVAAAVVSRRSGASPRSIVWIVLLAFLPYLLATANMRTQSLVYPLFVALLWLLAQDSRVPSRRVFLVFPLLALWSNLHGSAVVAAALASLYGTLFAMMSARRQPTAHWLPRATALTLGPLGCLLVSPYAADLPGYYRRVLVNPSFGAHVTEWARTTLSLTTLPFYILGFGCLWLLGRAGSRFTLFEKCVLLVTLGMSLLAIRNLVWFSLAAVCFLPAGLDEVLSGRTSGLIPRLNRTLGLAAGCIAIISLGLVLARPASWFTHDFPSQAADVAAKADAKESFGVYVNELYADWLMWQHPELEGRVAFDARFELLSAKQMAQIVAFRSELGPGWLQAANGYRVLVLDPVSESGVSDYLKHQGSSILFRDSHVVVIRRTAPSGAR